MVTTRDRAAEPVTVRTAQRRDVAGLCAFGEAHVRAHYAPLIGAPAAEAQVRDWWNEAHLGDAVAAGRVVVAEVGAAVVGVGQRGLSGADHVVHKLYVHPDHRGAGIGPMLLRALEAQLPPAADRLFLEHFVANARAGAFYEREGFTVDRVEPGPDGAPGLGVVWRVRPVTARGPAERD